MSAIRIALAVSALALFAAAPVQAGRSDGDKAGLTRPSRPQPVSLSSRGGGSRDSARKVPEPAGLGLFALGIAGITIGRLGLRRRRR